MSFERRDSSPAPEKVDTPKSSGGKKPVIVYIFVLFIVALLLMIWSLFSHQRSNTEALGQLQTSVSAMQEVQELQNQVITLQKELAEAQDALSTAEKERDLLDQSLSESQESADLLRRISDANYYLYALQQKYLLQDYDACREIIQAMEDGGMVELLSDGGSAADVTSPALRYQELKEAVRALEDRAP